MLAGFFKFLHSKKDLKAVKPDPIIKRDHLKWSACHFLYNMQQNYEGKRRNISIPEYTIWFQTHRHLNFILFKVIVHIKV